MHDRGFALMGFPLLGKIECMGDEPFHTQHTECNCFCVLCQLTLVSLQLLCRCWRYCCGYSPIFATNLIRIALVAMVLVPGWYFCLFPCCLNWICFQWKGYNWIHSSFSSHIPLGGVESVSGFFLPSYPRAPSSPVDPRDSFCPNM